jgi:hypothetical protein
MVALLEAEEWYYVDLHKVAITWNQMPSPVNGDHFDSVYRYQEVSTDEI